MPVGIKQRGKDPSKWTITFDLPRGADGARRQKVVSFTGTQREAVKERRRLMALADAGQIGSAGAMTVEQWCERWLRDHVKPNHAPRTYESRASVTHTHIIPHIGTIKLERLNASDILALLATLRQTANSNRSGTLSGTTQQNIFSALRAALGVAVRLGLIASNPCARVTSPKAEVHGLRVLSAQEAQTLLAQAATRSIQIETFITLAITTGLRFSELRGLCWKRDIDLDRGTLTVNKIGQRVTGQGIISKEPKTPDSKRQVALGADVVALLRKHKAAQNEVRLAAGGNWEDHDRVFTNEIGNYISEPQTRHIFYACLDAAGLPRMRIHDLRHTAATLMLANGINPKVVSERLGHASIEMTLRIYAHVTETMQRHAADTMDKLLKRDMHVINR